MKSLTAVDTSVVIAALVSWHESHNAARASLEQAMEGTPGVIVPVDVLVETYSVLTRLPAPHRLSPADAFRLLRENFHGSKTAALLGKDTWNLLESLAATDVAGGSVYDARIVAAARKAGANRILTMNVRHFERLVPDGFEVMVPGRLPTSPAH